MPTLLESIDLQRAIRAAAYKKAAQLYNGKNISRGWAAKPTINQIRGVFRIAYNQLYKAHPRIKWLDFVDKPEWLSKLDYIAARGGKTLMQELFDIIDNIGGRTAGTNLVRIIRRPSILPPEPPIESLDEAFYRAEQIMNYEETT